MIYGCVFAYFIILFVYINQNILYTGINRTYATLQFIKVLRNANKGLTHLLTPLFNFFGTMAKNESPTISQQL